MKHLYNLSDITLNKPSIVTIGVFDGVHRGHTHLLEQLVSEAHTSQRLAVGLTLFPHPDVVLRGLTGRYYLTTNEQKADLLGKLGVDVVVTHPFNDEVRKIRAAAFVDQLCEHLHMTSLWVTTDFAMGYQREGNFGYLTAQGAEKGFDVRQTNLVQADHSATISSSDLRKAILDGQVEQADAWL